MYIFARKNELHKCSVMNTQHIIVLTRKKEYCNDNKILNITT